MFSRSLSVSKRVHTIWQCTRRKSSRLIHIWVFASLVWPPMLVSLPSSCAMLASTSAMSMALSTHVSALSPPLPRSHRPRLAIHPSVLSVLDYSLAQSTKLALISSKHVPLETITSTFPSLSVINVSQPRPILRRVTKDFLDLMAMLSSPTESRPWEQALLRLNSPSTIYQLV